jgi:hypothetical protein
MNHALGWTFSSASTKQYNLIDPYYGELERAAVPQDSPLTGGSSLIACAHETR